MGSRYPTGQVAAAGPASDVLGGQLGLVPLSDDRDTGAVLDGRVAEHEPRFGLTRLATAAGDLTVPRLDRPVGAAVWALVRARDVMLCLNIFLASFVPGDVVQNGPDIAIINRKVPDLIDRLFRCYPCGILAS